MRSVLNVVGRPKLLSRGVVAFIEERVKSLEDQFLESALPDENQLATEKHGLLKRKKNTVHMFTA